MKELFEKNKCPFILKIKENEWLATVQLQKGGYYINYTNNEYGDPLDIDYEVVEGYGKELEEAIIDLKKILKIRKYEK